MAKYKLPKWKEKKNLGYRKTYLEFNFEFPGLRKECLDLFSLKP